ncbi:MAG: (2Fe-2S)-binding protein [Marinilabiliaceae bacterium]
MGRLICLCNHVHYRDLEKLIKKSPVMSMKEIIRHTGASSSCGRCFGELQSAVHAIRDGHANDSHIFRQLQLPFPDH